MKLRLASLPHAWPQWRPLVLRAALVVALAASLAWLWADPQGHRLPELTRQAQQLEQQIGAAARDVQARAQRSSDTASLAGQAMALRQRYWHPARAQQWLIQVHRQAKAAGVSLLDWRTLPNQAVAPGAGTATVAPAPLRVRMQLQGQQAALVRWFVGQVDAMPAAQVLDWHWQAQGGTNAASGQLTVLWSLPLRHSDPDGEKDEEAGGLTAPERPFQQQADLSLEQAPTPGRAKPAQEPLPVGAIHHWPGAGLSQLRFVGLWMGADSQDAPLALLSHVPSEPGALGQLGMASESALMASVRIGDVLGVPRVRVTHIDERGLTWRSADAQGQLVPAADASYSVTSVVRP